MVYDVIFIHWNWVFYPVALIDKLVYTKGETIQKHRIHKIENKHTKQGNKPRKNIEKHRSSN